MSMRAVRGYRSMNKATLAVGATPHGLITMLFDGALSQIEIARRATDATRRDASAAPTRRHSIDKAMAIVQELQASLADIEHDPLAARLFDLYGWIVHCLLRANRSLDDAGLDEARDLLLPIRDGWTSIDPERASSGA